jgi:hypothetical protein
LTGREVGVDGREDQFASADAMPILEGGYGHGVEFGEGADALLRLR